MSTRGVVPVKVWKGFYAAIKVKFCLPVTFENPLLTIRAKF